MKTFTVLFAVFLVLIILSIIPTKKTKERYQRLMDGLEDEQKIYTNYRQKREQVRKDLYLIEKERLQATLYAPLSWLLIEKQQGNAEVVEHLQRFACWMQEEINLATHQQIIRSFSAAEGKFYYQKELLVADQVLIARYNLPGNQLPLNARSERPLLKGVASHAELSFFDGFHFKAEHLKASFFLP